MGSKSLVFAVAVFLLGGCVAPDTTESAAPSSLVAQLAAAVTPTAAEPSSTPIRLPTATPGPATTQTASPLATVEAGDGNASDSPRLATPRAARPTGQPTAPTAVPPAAVPASATPVSASSQPLPSGPQNGPAPIATATPLGGESAPVDDRSRPLVERASQMLAAELGIALQEITLVLLEAVVWPDGGLGCAQPGAIVQPVETPGYRIVLAAAGAQYEFHTDLDTQVVRCETERTTR